MNKAAITWSELVAERVSERGACGQLRRTSLTTGLVFAGVLQAHDNQNVCLYCPLNVRIAQCQRGQTLSVEQAGVGCVSFRQFGSSKVVAPVVVVLFRFGGH